VVTVVLSQLLKTAFDKNEVSMEDKRRQFLHDQKTKYCMYLHSYTILRDFNRFAEYIGYFFAKNY